jgi:hypothetical protein
MALGGSEPGAQRALALQFAPFVNGERQQLASGFSDFAPIGRPDQRFFPVEAGCLRHAVE